MIKTVPHAWRAASHRYLWDKRAEAFDEYELLEEQKRWQEQHRKDRQIEHERGTALMERAEEMLSYPLAKVEYASGVEAVREPGRRAEIMAQLRTDGIEEEALSVLEAMPLIVVSITQIHPVRWQMRDAAILAKAGSTLMRQATGAPTSYQQHEVFGEKGSNGKPRDLFPIKQIIIKQAPKRQLPTLNTDAVAEPLENESPKPSEQSKKETD